MKVVASLLFDLGARTNSKPARYNEPRFQFLNRVESTFFGRVRDVLEDWFTRLPAASKADVRARFRSDDDGQMMAAFWELYLHEALIRAGFDLEPHPKIPNTSRRPDYRATRSHESFLLEAVIAIPGSKSDQGAERLLNQLHDELEKLETPNFFIGLDVVSVGRQSPPARRLRSTLESWLGTLDPDLVAADLEGANQYMDSPTFPWTEGDWGILFSAIPKSSALRGKAGVRAIGISGPAMASVVNRRSPIRRALDLKAASYGQPESEFVVAVLVQEFWATGITVKSVLYGELGSRLSPAKRREAGTDGFFFNPHAAKISAVLVATELAPWLVGRHLPRVWLNPLADRPLTLPLPWPAVSIDVAAKEEPALIDMRDLFGLSPDWPGPEPPFADS